MLEKAFEKYDTIIVFDTETTGLDSENCQIIELAAIRLNKVGNVFQNNQEEDMLIRLPEGEKIPEKIIELTHITDEMLEKEGISEKEAIDKFLSMIDGKTLLCAYNAQFDINFVVQAVLKVNREMVKVFNEVDYIDPLTIFKDRRLYPHKLENAIIAYDLQDKVQNSHRAIDDTLALFEVLKSMDEEREDLEQYINIFGYNPKFGIYGKEFKKIKYIQQLYRKEPEMVMAERILPKR